MANILVIGDEVILLDLIANAGHDLTPLCGPLAALGAQATGHRRIDLLLTEIDMEPISGFELARRLSKTRFTGPVLFMSGYPALAGAVAENLGERAVLEKPFTVGKLRAAVRRALAASKPKFNGLPEFASPRYALGRARP